MDTLARAETVEIASPIEVIDGCHDAMRRAARALCALAAQPVAHGVPYDRAGRETAGAVLACFDSVAREHHRDEEDDLFPALFRHVASAELNAVRALVFRLRAEHRRIEALWATMREPVAAVVAGYPAHVDATRAAAFAHALERHLAFEDAQLLPLASRVLDPRLSDHVARRMARRRGP
jgi:hypothetical protein